MRLGPYEPTQEEIRRGTARIRHDWSKQTHNRRLNDNYKATPYTALTEGDLELSKYANHFFRALDPETRVA